MKCPLCKGRKVEQILTDGMVDIVNCKCCSGTGVVEPLTNEEWFCGLSTEEKAIFITMFALRRKFVNKGAFYESVKNSLINASELPKMPINLRRSVEEWLKEKHDGNS